MSSFIQTQGCKRRKEGAIRITRGFPLERFFSQLNIQRYRKLPDKSTDEPERRLIFKLLAEEQDKFRHAREDL